jgi:hypothetical protein
VGEELALILRRGELVGACHRLKIHLDGTDLEADEPVPRWLLAQDH